MTRLADHVPLTTKNDLTPTKEQTSSGDIKTTWPADIFQQNSQITRPVS
jgi:hypothetical protein